MVEYVVLLLTIIALSLVVIAWRLIAGRQSFNKTLRKVEKGAREVPTVAASTSESVGRFTKSWAALILWFVLVAGVFVTPIAIWVFAQYHGDGGEGVARFVVNSVAEYTGASIEEKKAAVDAFEKCIREKREPILWFPARLTESEAFDCEFDSIPFIHEMIDSRSD